jgi:hypothetical protein
MRYYNVGEVITFNNTFWDANDNQTTVLSANLTIVYPTSTPSGKLLSRDPGKLKSKTTIAMTEDMTTHIWSANWDSSPADPGQVFYSMAGGGIVEEGIIVLRGNLATLEAANPLGP